MFKNTGERAAFFNGEAKNSDECHLKG